MSFPRALPKNLVIIAFSDTHGDADKLARLHTSIERKMEQDKIINPNVQHVLLIPGDVFSVNAVFSTVSKGQFDIDVITKIAELFPEQHRFFTPGNHDFFYEESQLVSLVNKAKLRVVISNATFEKNSQLKFEPLATLVLNDEKMIIGGLMTPETLNNPGGKKVLKEEKSIDTRPAAFVQKAPDILMSHLGSESDKQLPYQTIIVGGHTHDRQIVPADNKNNGKLIINTGAGECIVVIQDGKAEIIETKDQQPSPKILNILSRYERDYKINFNELKQTVFKVAADSTPPSGLEISSEEIKTTQSHLRVSDSCITRLTADGIAAGLRKQGHTVDFVLYPAAAVRSNFAPGQAVTGQQLFETYYYSNKLVTMSLTTKQLIALLAHGVMSGYKCWANRGQLLTPSAGLTYGYNIDEENPGDTIQWVKVNNQLVDLNASYSIVTTDWIAGEAKKIFPTLEVIFYADETKIFKLVTEHIKEHPLVLKEAYSERIIAAQSLQEQERLTQQDGNRRADKPTFDKYQIHINFDLQDFFNSENAESALKGKKIRTLIMEYAGLLFTRPNLLSAPQTAVVLADKKDLPKNTV